MEVEEEGNYIPVATLSPVSRFGLAGKRKDFGSIPLRLSFLFKKAVVCGHCLVTVHHFLLKH